MKIISENVTRSIGRKILKVKKNSPHIFFVGGVVGVVGSTVLACRATLKLEKTLDDIKKDFDVVEELKKLRMKVLFIRNKTMLEMLDMYLLRVLFHWENFMVLL